MTSRKKAALAGALVLVMAVSAVGGTLAWLNDTDSLTNTFLVGAFTEPTDPVPKPDPDDPDDPDNSELTGYIHEPLWDKNTAGGGGSGTPKTEDKHRLVPGGTTVKDPYVGIGKDSEAGYIYVYIKNDLGDQVRFQLNENWVAVGGHATEVTSETGWYVDGLFKYVTNQTDKTLLALDPSKTVAAAGSTPASNTTGRLAANGDLWTLTPVFSTVKTVAGESVLSDLNNKASKTMTVYAFIYQQKDTAQVDEQDSGVAMDTTDPTKTVVEAAAIKWAGTNEEGYPGYTPPAST